MVKLDALVKKEGVGKVTLSFRFNSEDENNCFVSFKLKLSKKHKEPSQAVKIQLANDDSLVPKGNDTYVIYCSDINNIQATTSPPNSFTITTKQGKSHVFLTTKKVRKRWVETITKYLNEFKICNKSSVRNKLRSQENVFSNTMKFHNSARQNSASASSLNYSTRTLDSKGHDYEVFKSPRLGRSLQRNMNSSSKGLAQFQALSKTASKCRKLKDKSELSGSFDSLTLNSSFLKNCSQFSLETERDIGKSPPPPPPPLPTTTKKKIQTYVKPKSTCLTTNSEPSRKVVIPSYDEDIEHRDYGKTEDDLKFLRSTVRTSRGIQKVVAQNFDDRALEDMIEKMFKQTYLIDERVISAGDEVRFLYILDSGYFVQTIPKSKTFVKRMSKGSIYGEMQLKYGTPSTFTVDCRKTSVFWCLARQDYLEIARQNGIRNQNLRVEVLKSVETFKNTLSVEQFQLLATSLDMHFATEGEVVLDFEKEVKNVILVAQGEIHLFGEQDQYPRAKLEKGDHFGMLGLFEPVVSKFKLVVADRKTVFFVLKIKEFDELFGGIKNIIEKVMKEHELRKRTTELVKRKPLTIIEELRNIRETHSTLKSLPPVSQPGLTTPCLGSVVYNSTFCLLNDDDSVDDDSEPDIETHDLPFLDSPPLLPNIEFDDLEILNKISAGSFGKVYTTRFKEYENPKSRELKILKASHKTKQSFPEYAPIGFALKVMARRTIKKRSIQDKVDNEMLAMAEVSHYCRSPFILALYHTFACPRFVYLLIELGEGRDLYELLKIQKNKRFTESEARYYIASVINGLDVLHQRNIVYRDLKPENLILNGKGHLKIADLGLAKKTTRTSTMCGTPEYMAPEVINTTGHDHACDWWSLGILVYELHYGQTPFYASSSDKIYRKIENHRYPVQFYAERKLNKKDKKYGYLKGKHNFSVECKDLIAKLLVPKSSLRLGYVRPGPNKIRKHAYFANHDFDWNKLSQLKISPPFVIDIHEEDKVENLEKDPYLELCEIGKDHSTWEPKVNTVLEYTPRI